MDNLTTCSRCGSDACYVQEVSSEIKLYHCYGCGFQANTAMKRDSEFLKEQMDAIFFALLFLHLFWFCIYSLHWVYIRFCILLCIGLLCSCSVNYTFGLDWLSLLFGYFASFRCLCLWDFCISLGCS